MFEIASDEASRLSQLTTEFLDYASTRPPNLAPTSLADAIAYVADASRAHASQKGIRFQLDVLEKVIVQVDESQLHQALMNLLLNAVDATPAGGTITLRCRNGNQSACIEVENAGLPIPESALNRIFEPFFTTKPRGTGLGLAIARNIARAQGGDLTLFTNVPARICFALSLPVSNDGIKTKKV
jgi:two-component system sensor histidine kinase AtoS